MNRVFLQAPALGPGTLAAWLVMALALVSAAAADDAAKFVVIATDVPAAVQPGERIIASVKVRVAQPGAAVVLRPAVSLVSGTRENVAFNVPDRQLTPWDWPAARKAGDVLAVIHANDLSKADEARRLVDAAFLIAHEPVTPLPLFYDVIV